MLSRSAVAARMTLGSLTLLALFASLSVLAEDTPMPGAADLAPMMACEGLTAIPTCHYHPPSGFCPPYYQPPSLPVSLPPMLYGCWTSCCGALAGPAEPPGPISTTIITRKRREEREESKPGTVRIEDRKEAATSRRRPPTVIRYPSPDIELVDLPLNEQLFKPPSGELGMPPPGIPVPGELNPPIAPLPETPEKTEQPPDTTEPSPQMPAEQADGSPSHESGASEEDTRHEVPLPDLENPDLPWDYDGTYGLPPTPWMRGEERLGVFEIGLGPEPDVAATIQIVDTYADESTYSWTYLVLAGKGQLLIYCLEPPVDLGVTFLVRDNGDGILRAWVYLPGFFAKEFSPEERRSGSFAGAALSLVDIAPITAFLEEVGTQIGEGFFSVGAVNPVVDVVCLEANPQIGAVYSKAVYWIDRSHRMATAARYLNELGNVCRTMEVTAVGEFEGIRVAEEIRVENAVDGRVTRIHFLDRRRLDTPLPDSVFDSEALGEFDPVALGLTSHGLGTEEMIALELGLAATVDPTIPRGGTLRVGVRFEPRADPALASTCADITLLNAAYDYLFDVDAENRLVQRLATSCSVNADRTTYVLQLAEGVRFHDGSPLTPEDVIWTFDPLRDPGISDSTRKLGNIETIVASGENGVTFHLSEPDPLFPYALADRRAVILKAGTQDFSAFNGTGPFIVEEFSPDAPYQTVLRANPSYFAEGLPYLDELIFLVIPEVTTTELMLLNGDLDLALDISAYSIADLSASTSPGIVIDVVSTNRFDAVRLRSDMPPGNDPRVIQALRLATDRQAVNEELWMGLAVVGSDTPIGPAYGDAYDPTLIPDYDPQAAKQLLIDAGYGSGLSIDFHVRDFGILPSLADILASQWDDIGVDVSIYVEPYVPSINSWFNEQLAAVPWAAAFHPHYYVENVLRCDGALNAAVFCDSDMEELAEIAVTTFDDVERNAAYVEIQRILVQRGPYIIPYFYPAIAAYSDRFADIAFHPCLGRTDLRVVHLR